MDLSSESGASSTWQLGSIGQRFSGFGGGTALNLVKWIALDVQETVLMNTVAWEVQPHNTEKITYPRVVT